MRFAIVSVLVLSCAAPKPRTAGPEPMAPGALIVRVYQGGFLTAGAGIGVEVASGPAKVAAAKTNACGVVLLEPLPDGIYTVTARDGERVNSAEAVNVQTGKDTDIRIVLPPPEAASGAAPACTPPSIVSGPNPQMNAPALEHRIEGCMVFSCRIEADGKMKHCKTIQPLAHLTDDALASLNQRIYRPSLCAGVPTAVDDYLVRIFVRIRYSDPLLDAPPPKPAGQ
jgi:hypothetical protein